MAHRNIGNRERHGSQPVKYGEGGSGEEGLISDKYIYIKLHL